MSVKDNGVSTVVLVALVLALGIGYFMWTHPTPQVDLEQARARVEQLNNRLDSISKQQVIQDSALVKYRDQLDAKDEEIAASKQQIAKIKSYYENKIRSISDMSVNQLDSFYTARYGQR